MPNESLTSQDPNAMTMAHVLRAIIKALLLFVAFNLAYRACQPVQTGHLPTVYNTLVEGLPRLAWEIQSDVPMLIKDHAIQQATPDTWTIAMLGSSETFGWPLDYRRSASAILDDWGLETQTGQRVRVYNLSIPSADLWKDLMVAQKLLDSGVHVDLLVFNVLAYTLETGYPHDIVIRNPALARTIVERYDVDSSWLAYLSDVGIQTFWTERETLAFWLNTQAEALTWQATHRDTYETAKSVRPLSEDLGSNENLPITRADFLQVIRKMADEYGVVVLLINAPRPYAEDSFSVWIQEQAPMHGIALLDCEFIFAPPMFYDNIHMMPSSYPEYARVLIKHLTSAEIGGVSPDLPLRLPADFTPPEQSCVFQPAP